MTLTPCSIAILIASATADASACPLPSNALIERISASGYSRTIASAMAVPCPLSSDGSLPMTEMRARTLVHVPLTPVSISATAFG